MVTNSGDTGLSGDGSLRGEIAAAASGDTIEFAGNVQGITLTNGQLVLGKSLDIEGPVGNPIVISGYKVGASYHSRVFEIDSGAIVTLSGLMITNGGVMGGVGGGILNEGTLTVSQCTLSGNNVTFTPGTNSGKGGGICNLGVLTVSNSTLSGNSAGFAGGGIFNEGTNPPVSNRGTVTVSNSTLSGNSGGGIFNAGTLTVSNSTLSGNVSHSLSGNVADGIDDGTGPLTLVNTIVDEVGIGVNGAVVSTSHHNLIGNGIGMPEINGFNGNHVGTAAHPIDPRLGPLQDNGGPTQTMALLAGSPALDAGDPALLWSTDQRGVPRLGGVNVGAYQASASAFQLTLLFRVVVPGQPLPDLTVTAVDPFGEPAVDYRGTVHFSSTDPQATLLPADYTFTATDNGQHTFSSGLTLFTPGSQTVSAAPNSLISAWRGEGNPLDVMGRNNGSVAGGVTYAAGMVDQAFSFDGTGQVLVNDAPSLDLSRAVSLEAWINPSTLAFSNGFGAIIAKSGNGTQNYTRNYGLFVTSGGALHLSYFTSGGANVILQTADNLVPAGQFSHVAATINTGAGVMNIMNIYVNGQLVASQPTAGPLVADTVPLTIGNSDSESYGFQGLIDEATIYNRALSAPEIGSVSPCGSVTITVYSPPAARSTPALSASPGGELNSVDSFFALVNRKGSAIVSPADSVVGSGDTNAQAAAFFPTQFRLDGAAFGVANNSTRSVDGLLLALNNQASNGILYNGNPMQPTLQGEAAALFDALNQAGCIP
jgi:hypothetical protein